VDFPTFVKAMGKCGLYYSEDELYPLFQQYDQDGSGSLDYKEFSCIVYGADNAKGQMLKRPAIN
jgi:Ca2+-binding EF-hand superfamily protein